MSTGQTGHKPGGVPPKFFMFIGFKVKSSGGLTRLSQPDLPLCPRPPLGSHWQTVISLGDTRNFHQIILGCAFFAYSWKLPAYSGAFLLTVDSFSFFACNWSLFAYNLAFCLQLELSLAYSGKVRLVRALRDCKQRSLTVSKKSPAVPLDRKLLHN